MRNIYSNIFKVNNKNLSKATIYLQKKQIVGVPTETVYGLAGNGYSKEAVKKIYHLKKRPFKNPLIIHYLNLEQLKNDVKLTSDFYKLYKKFCPGPITFVLNKKKNSLLTGMATANLITGAVRVPKNIILRKILQSLNFPLAIPSANKSTQVSSVSARDVVNEFGASLKFILDGGRCVIGLESTVVDLTSRAKILRPGLISSSDISKILKKKLMFIKNLKLLKHLGC